MSTYLRQQRSPAQDNFERYYVEKIWDYIPAIYKDEDGLAATPAVLRSFVLMIARQAAIARRSVDRLWEDAFIELCDDWAIPYIGDLLGTRLVHELNRRGRRADVARTIFYRRRKGTPLVLEILIEDIADVQGTVVESFRRLARTRHGLDPEPTEFEGLVTRTPPGGWAKLTSTRGAELVDGPFDEFAHTPDFRQRRGKLGRYNIPKLNFHLFRLRPFAVRFATPASFGAGRFSFDPSGRDSPLFRPDQRPPAEDWHAAREWELPAPLRCRLLGSAQYVISAEVVDGLVAQGLSPAAAEQLSRYVGVPFPSEARLRQTLLSLSESTAILGHLPQLLSQSLTPESPKGQLIPRAVAVAIGLDQASEPFSHEQIIAGNLDDWGVSLGSIPAEKALVIDPERGRFWLTHPPSDNFWVPICHYGFSGDIGAGSYERRASLVTEAVTVLSNGGDQEPGPVALTLPATLPNQTLELQDDKTYLPDVDVVDIERFTFQAANFQRPYLKRVVPAGSDWVFRAKPKPAVLPGAAAAEADLRCLTLDGLWIGIEPEGLVPTPTPCSPIPAALVLEGTFDRVTIRHCTLDPGGTKARLKPGECQSIPYVRLVVRGHVEELVIESSIVGPIVEDMGGTPAGTIGKLCVSDSIVHSIDPASPAIATALGTVELQRVTLFGDLRVNRLSASEALVQGLVQVTDNQHGCFRFSATSKHPERRLPAQFESHLFGPSLPNHFFSSRRFGDPSYAQLSDTAPEALQRGAENRSEIGAFNRLFQPIARGDLAAKAEELMPFGLIAQFINET